MAEDTEADLEKEGLIGVSYDSFFKIDKRVRKVQDLHLPTRAGISVNQIATFFIVLLFSFLFYALIIVQVTDLFGISVHWFVTVLLIVAPPLLCAWRVSLPMPSGKSIPGTARSLLTYYLDDPVHRRGRPIKTDPRPPDEFVQHYMRDWTVSEEFAAEVPGEGDWTDDDTEKLFVRCTGHINLQEWIDQKAIENYLSASEIKRDTTAKEITVHDRRGTAATVLEE